MGRQRSVWFLHQRCGQWKRWRSITPTPLALAGADVRRDDLYARYLDHVCELTETLFNDTHLHERIDVVTELIASSVYADDNKMYSNADFDVNVVSNLSGGGGPYGERPTD